jgi:predicted RNase H-like nuclease (RuvC/YqgF family)
MYKLNNNTSFSKQVLESKSEEKKIAEMESTIRRLTEECKSLRQELDKTNRTLRRLSSQISSIAATVRKN